MNYDELDYSSIHNKEDINFLIITATTLETKILHENMTFYDNFDKIAKITHKGHAYFIGKLGCHNIVHVQCSDMGTMAQGSSIITTTNAIDNWINIKVVIMVGICFGIDEEKQKIGDILVSDIIIPYENRRVGAKEEIPRGKPILSDRALTNHFNSLKPYWEYETEDFEKTSLEICPILSGEKLVDNKDFRDQLKKENPTALGGEMEGSGVGAACENKKKPWIIVKAICDFADGNKGKDKRKNQTIAAKSAINCCIQALNSNKAFKDFGINIEECNSKYISNISKSLINEVLFEAYDEKISSEYYILRDIDNTIEGLLGYFGIWIFGDSGVGKTTAILYNLAKCNKTPILFNLADCINYSIDDFFKEIYLELIEITTSVKSNDLNGYADYVKAIIKLLIENYPEKEIFLLLEEIPLSNNESYKEFVEKFNAFVIKTNGTIKSNIKVKFILSSIDSPKQFIPKHQTKVETSIKIIEMQKWSDEECIKLVNIINNALNLNLSEDHKIKIINNLDHSPRAIKMFFKNAFSQKIYCFDNDTIDRTLITCKN